MAFYSVEVPLTIADKSTSLTSYLVPSDFRCNHPDCVELICEKDKERLVQETIERREAMIAVEDEGNWYSYPSYCGSCKKLVSPMDGAIVNLDVAFCSKNCDSKYVSIRGPNPKD